MKTSREHRLLVQEQVRSEDSTILGVTLDKQCSFHVVVWTLTSQRPVTDLLAEFIVVGPADVGQIQEPSLHQGVVLCRLL